MVRLEGSKNKPKSLKDLANRLEKVANEQGITFTYTIGDTKNVAEKPDESAEEAAEKAGVSREAFSKLELELDSAEKDSFECGNCGANMGSKLDKCPDCRAQLSW